MTTLRPVVDTSTVVPAETSHARLLAHSRRVATLLAVHGHAPPPGDSPITAPWHDVVAVGVGLSVVVDLDLRAPDAVSAGDAWQRASGLTPAAWRAAIRADVPRYDPGRLRQDCPGRGQRGGKCAAPQHLRRPGRQVLDPVTGVYVTALICRDHWDEVAAAAHAAPDPPLDRGGVLARTFPEWDLDVVYSWVDPRYEPGVIPGEYAGRPRLRVVGGAS